MKKVYWGIRVLAGDTHTHGNKRKQNVPMILARLFVYSYRHVQTAVDAGGMRRTAPDKSQLF